MRIDKYLKVSRIIKRRQIAKEACDAGRVSINGVICKAGSLVKVGDRIEVAFGTKTVQVEVLQLSENANKAISSELYRVLKS